MGGDESMCTPLDASGYAFSVCEARGLGAEKRLREAFRQLGCVPTARNHQQAVCHALRISCKGFAGTTCNCQLSLFANAFAQLVSADAVVLL